MMSLPGGLYLERGDRRGAEMGFEDGGGLCIKSWRCQVCRKLLCRTWKGEILRTILAVNFCGLNFVVKMITSSKLIMDEFLFPSLPPLSTPLQYETDQGTGEEGRRKRQGRIHPLLPERCGQRLRWEIRSPG